MPEEKKRNDIKGLERCPHGTDVGPLGRSSEFVDTFTAGFIYATAIDELVRRTQEIEEAIDLIHPDERHKVLANLEEEMQELDAKWILATAMFAIDA